MQIFEEACSARMHHSCVLLMEVTRQSFDSANVLAADNRRH